jgi:HlyD family secretion protein
MSPSDFNPFRWIKTWAEDLRLDGLNTEMQEFAPGILKIQQRPPSPLPRVILYILLALCGVALTWAIFGKLDIIAVADGKLVPQTYIKIVQPADAGIVKDILVKEGDSVVEGQVLVRMDAIIAEADSKTVQAEYFRRAIQLRRIAAELADQPLKKQATDPEDLYRQAQAQYQANRMAYQDALAQERTLLSKAREDLSASQEVQGKLKQVLPVYQRHEQAYDQMAKEGYVGKLEALDKSRERIEKEQDLRTQTFTIASLQASINQSEKKLAQITSNYRQQLNQERLEALGQFQKLEQDLAKQTHKNTLLELRAPQAGVVKDLATHTSGTVVSPGTVVLTLVPKNEMLLAEVWVSNDDSGFVHANQTVKVKLAAYPFQKYGMIDGVVQQVGADASDAAANKNATNNAASPNQQDPQDLKYKAIVALKSQYLTADGERHLLSPGMRASAEINLGTRTIMEYLLSPVQKAYHEAGRER